MEPLAFRMRPTCLNEVIGQKHLIGKNKILRNGDDISERNR